MYSFLTPILPSKGYYAIEKSSWKLAIFAVYLVVYFFINSLFYYYLKAASNSFKLTESVVYSTSFLFSIILSAVVLHTVLISSKVQNLKFIKSVLTVTPAFLSTIAAKLLAFFFGVWILAYLYVPFHIAYFAIGLGKFYKVDKTLAIRVGIISVAATHILIYLFVAGRQLGY